MNKQEAADLALIKLQDPTFDETLKEENIKISMLPEEQPDEAFISLKQKTFSEKDKKDLAQLPNQTVDVIKDQFIVAAFKKPIPMPQPFTEENITEVVKRNIIYPSEYVFGEWNKELNVLLFYQTKNNRPVYLNQNGILLIYLNNNNEMVSYTQAMLGDTVETGEKKKAIMPITAIEKLYNNNQLYSGDEITKVDLGFHTTVPLPNGVQVFLPSWRIVVNDDNCYFVSAIEADISAGNVVEFLDETLQANLLKVHMIQEDKKEVRESVTAQLETRLESIRRSETE